MLHLHATHTHTHTHTSFIRPEILEQLIKMIAKEPEEDVEDKVKFKSVVAVFQYKYVYSCTYTHLTLGVNSKQGVLAVSVCLSVCLCVCLSVCYHSSSGMAQFYAQTKV